MSKWLAKLESGEYGKSTPKTPRSPNSQITADFLRLVRVTGACEWGVLLEDRTILAELDADDLGELTQTDRRDKQVWAELLSYRLSMQRLNKAPPRSGDTGGNGDRGGNKTITQPEVSACTNST